VDQAPQATPVEQRTQSGPSRQGLPEKTDSPRNSGIRLWYPACQRYNRGARPPGDDGPMEDNPVDHAPGETDEKRDAAEHVGDQRLAGCLTRWGTRVTTRNRING
jgi:hypothetical protein